MSTQHAASIEVLKDGSRVTIRPLNKNDTELEREFITRLSPQARRLRFFSSMISPSDSLLKLLTDLDESNAAAFIALTVEPGVQREIGVARMSAVGDGSAEFAVHVMQEFAKTLGFEHVRNPQNATEVIQTLQLN
jgi:hypothetical protein